MSGSTRYYQIGGHQGHIRSRDYSASNLAEMIAGDRSPLRQESKGIELVLGIKVTGTTHILATEDQANRLSVSRELDVNRRTNYLAPEDFVSLSPLPFKSSKDLEDVILFHVPKSKKNQRGPADHSKANTSFLDSNSTDGILRGSVEHSRLLFRLLNNDSNLDIRSFSLQDLRWMQDLRIFALSFNTWSSDNRPKEEQRRNPKIIDFGLTQMSLPDLLPINTRHFLVHENQLLAQGRLEKVAYAHGSSEVISKAQISEQISRILSVSQEPVATPILLLVHGDSSTRDALISLGFNIDRWQTGIQNLLNPWPRQGAGRHRSQNHDFKDKVKRRSRSRSPVRSKNTYEPRRRSPSPHKYKPGSTSQHSPYAHPPAYAPVYLIDVQEMFQACTATTSNSARIPEIACALGLSRNPRTCCAGNECVDLVDIWRTIAGGPSIIERQMNRSIGAPQVWARPVQVNETSAENEEDEEDGDPNDQVPGPTTSTSGTSKTPYDDNDEVDGNFGYSSDCSD